MVFLDWCAPLHAEHKLETGARAGTCSHVLLGASSLDGNMREQLGNIHVRALTAAQQGKGRWFFFLVIVSSHRQKHPTVHCLSFRSPDFRHEHKQMGTHRCMRQAWKRQVWAADYGTVGGCAQDRFSRQKSSGGLPSRSSTFQPCRMWRSLSSQFSPRTGFNSVWSNRKCRRWCLTTEIQTRTAEQIIDIPALPGCGGACLHSFLPGQVSTAFLLNRTLSLSLRFGKGSGLSNGVTDPVTLKVLSWDVAGLSKDSTDIFLSQIFDAHSVGYAVVARPVFIKLDGVNVGVHERFTPSELVGRDCDAQQLSNISDGADKRELLWERADGLQSSWVGQLTVISAHLHHKGRQLEMSRRFWRKSRISCEGDWDNT